MHEVKEVDIIIAGGGAAGCVVAGRLAAADPSLEILLIEQGQNNYNVPEVVQPAMYLTHLKPESTTAKFYRGRISKHLGERSPIVPTGNILGGGSSINFMAYTRASGSDYDDWEIDGWSQKDLLPLLRKLETYTLGTKNSAEVHGLHGPVKVSYGGFRHVELMGDFVQAVQAKGYPVVDDVQDLKTIDAFQHSGKWIDLETGRRSDAAHSYVHHNIGPEKSKLKVLCDSTVSRVIIENSKAVGVEYVPAIDPNKANNSISTPEPKIVRARKLVVVSSGALGSPQLLERSGIGNPEILRKAGVKCLVDLPGVGTDYQDHTLLQFPFRVDQSVETHDHFFRGIPEIVSKAKEDFKTGKGYLATNMIDVAGKIRPNQKELAELGPEFRKVWDKYFKDAPDKPVIYLAMINSFVGDYTLVPPGKYVTAATYLEYPVSRGYIHITSHNPYSDPDFDPGFLSHPADLAPNMWAYKISREIIRRMKSYRGEPPSFHPKFSSSSSAAARDIDVRTSEITCPSDTTTRAKLTSPQLAASPPIDLESYGQSQSIEDLAYSDEDDRALEQWVRDTIGTTWHSLGTLAMKPRQQNGVVDEKLNVYGVENLKVADLSICPGNVGGNTYNTALLIGEKAAILCGEHVGISTV